MTACACSSMGLRSLTIGTTMAQLGITATQSVPGLRPAFDYPAVFPGHRQLRDPVRLAERQYWRSAAHSAAVLVPDAVNPHARADQHLRHADPHQIQHPDTNSHQIPIPLLPSNTPLPTNTPLPPTNTPIRYQYPDHLRIPRYLREYPDTLVHSIPSNTPVPSDTPVPSNTPTPSITPTLCPYSRDFSGLCRSRRFPRCG